jgi:two-component system, chemotaxis family, protein-glutamate methylesterase/glutaminase
MANRDILAIGTSAGGVDALRFTAGEFPRDLPASVLVTIHLSSRFESSLDELIAQSGPLPATFATNGEVLKKGRIYIAPPEHHLIVDTDRLWLGDGPRENYARPAIDPMFRSAAICCAARAIGVVMTGTLGDGASGLLALKQSGGITVVQDPSDAIHPEMPMMALSRAKPDHVVRLADLPPLLVSLVREPAGKPLAFRTGSNLQIARNGGSKTDPMNGFRYLDEAGRRSVLACPDCGGGNVGDP